MSANATPRVQRIHRTLTEVFDLASVATFSVDAADFGDWLAALGWTEFYVSRRADGAGLHVLQASYWDGHYVQLDTRGVTAVLGHEIPEEGHLTLPASEAANLRGEAALVSAVLGDDRQGGDPR